MSLTPGTVVLTRHEGPVSLEQATVRVGRVELQQIVGPDHETAGQGGVPVGVGRTVGDEVGETEV